MRTEGHNVTVLFLDATTPVLVQRYDATRRKHPFADETDGLLEAIELERDLLEPVRGQADLVIDTSDLNVHQLKDRLVAAFERSTPAADADRGRELRLQERPPARRRHRDGRAVPPEPSLGR